VFDPVNLAAIPTLSPKPVYTVTKPARSKLFTFAFGAVIKRVLPDY
jgi:hypothetical protein